MSHPFEANLGKQKQAWTVDDFIFLVSAYEGGGGPSRVIYTPAAY